MSYLQYVTPGRVAIHCGVINRFFLSQTVVLAINLHATQTSQTGQLHVWITAREFQFDVSTKLNYRLRFVTCVYAGRSTSALNTGVECLNTQNRQSL